MTSARKRKLPFNCMRVLGMALKEINNKNKGMIQTGFNSSMMGMIPMTNTENTPDESQRIKKPSPAHSMIMQTKPTEQLDSLPEQPLGNGPIFDN